MSVLSSSSLSGACSASRSLGPIAKVKQFPTIAQTKKYDFARSIAADVVSSQMIRRSRMPVASREWNEEKWEEVVLLKDIAGVTQAGKRNPRPVIVTYKQVPILPKELISVIGLDK